MKLKHLLEQLPPQEGEKDLKVTFKTERAMGGYVVKELTIDRITILGDVVITLVEK